MNFTDFKKSIQTPAHQIVFVGLGNEARGDDAAGLFFLNELENCAEFNDSAFIEARANPENHLQRILEHEPELVVFIDAAYIGATPGDMGWIDRDRLDTARISTHAFNITMVEQYLKSNQEMEVRYFGIQPETTTMGQPVSGAIMDNLKLFFR
jgi:hydrogenase maturation protease